MEQFKFRNNNDDKNLEQQNDIIWSWSSPDNKLEQQKNTNDMLQSRNEQKLKAELLGKCLEYGITEDDFDVKVKDGVPIIYSKSTYFSSLLGLNWPDEKGKILDKEVDKKVYDEFDKKISDWTEWKTEIEQFCKKNWIDVNVVGANGGCVYDNYVCIKYTPYVQCEEKKDWIEPTINHESQHVKFNKYCEENWIEQNWYLRILNEVIAHCTNITDKEWNIYFGEIYSSMKKNENYIKISWFSKRKYLKILKKIIRKTKKNLKSNELDKTMEMLIAQYKD